MNSRHSELAVSIGCLNVLQPGQVDNKGPVIITLQSGFSVSVRRAVVNTGRVMTSISLDGNSDELDAGLIELTEALGEPCSRIPVWRFIDNTGITEQAGWFLQWPDSPPSRSVFRRIGDRFNPFKK